MFKLFVLLAILDYTLCACVISTTTVAAPVEEDDGGGGPILGGISPVDLSDPNNRDMINNLLTFALGEYSAQQTQSTGQEVSYEAIEVTSATEQVVAGIKYVITARFRDANCVGGSCVEQTCSFSVLEQSWMDPANTFNGAQC